MIALNDENKKTSARRNEPDRRQAPDPNYTGPERRVADRRKLTDRRKYIRYRAKDHVYVNIRSQFDEEIGQLIDISKGGLSLNYPLNSDKTVSYDELGILSSIDLATERISFETISDIEMLNQLNSGRLKLRRHGLQFKNLTSEQEAKLDYFIKNFTLGEA